MSWFHESLFDQFKSFFERYDLLIHFDIVDKIMRIKILNDENSACILVRIFLGLENLHDFHCILVPINHHSDIEYFIMSFLFIRWLTQLQINTFLVLVNSIKPELRHIVSEKTIRIVHSHTSQLKLERWLIIRGSLIR